MNIVPDCKNVQDFLNIITNYNGIAFSMYDKSIKYRDFCDNIYKVAMWLKNNNSEKYICLTINDTYYFAIGFLSILLSGKIAVLYNFNEVMVDYYNLTIDTIKSINSSKKHIDNLSFSIESEKLSVLVPSSGTTSHKKAVMLSQKNLFCNTVSAMRNYLFGYGFKYVNVIPCTHLFGLVADILAPLYSGGTICVLNSKYEFFSALPKYNPNALNLPPIMIEQLCELLERSRDKEKVVGKNLYKIMCGGAKISEETIERIKLYGIQVYTSYGLTECSPCVSACCDNDYQRDSAGKILDCCTVKFSDGEILVSGDNVMIGYWRDPEVTKQVLIDGWLHTGDMGYLDDNHNLHVIGRKNTLLVFSNGFKLLPEPLEELINNIRGVKESLVFIENNSLKDKVTVKLFIEESAEKEIIATQIETIFLKHTEVSINRIIYSYSPLQRTELGKIKRCQY